MLILAAQPPSQHITSRMFPSCCHPEQMQKTSPGWLSTTSSWHHLVTELNSCSPGGIAATLFLCLRCCVSRQKCGGCRRAWGAGTAGNVFCSAAGKKQQLWHMGVCAGYEEAVQRARGDEQVSENNSSLFIQDDTCQVPSLWP